MPCFSYVDIHMTDKYRNLLSNKIKFAGWDFRSMPAAAITLPPDVFVISGTRVVGFHYDT